MCQDAYDKKIELGVAREQARKDLPLASYTEAYWKIDLQNLLRFLALRMDSKAQLEIRQYAEVIGNEIVKRWCPQTWEAFKDYREQSLHLSQQDQQVIQAIAKGDLEDATELAFDFGYIALKDDKTITRIEGIELSNKLKMLGMPTPWED